MAVPFVRYKMQFEGVQADYHTLAKYTIIIRDTVLTGDLSSDFKTSSDGFSITYPTLDNEPQDTIFASRCNIPFLVQTTQDQAFVDTIIADQEGRYYVEIVEGENLYWRGVIIQDETEHENRDRPYLIDLQAVDGLTQLQTKSGSVPSSEKSLLERIVFFLNQSEVEILYENSDEFLLTNFRWYEDQMLNLVDPLANMRYVYNGVEFEINSDGDTDYNTYYDILKFLLYQLNLRIIMINGVYNIVQPNNYKTTDLTVFRYSKNYQRTVTDPQSSPTGVISSNETLPVLKLLDNNSTIATGVYNQESGALFQYVGALNSVFIDFEFNYQKVIVIRNTDLSTLYDTNETVFSQTDLGVQFVSKTRVKTEDTTLLTPNTYDFDLKLEITLKIGSYYYDGSSWTLTPSIAKTVNAISENLDSLVGFSVTMFNVSIKTPEPPAQGNLEVKYEASILKPNNTNNNANQVIFEQLSDLDIEYYNVNGQVIPDLITYTAQNNLIETSSIDLDLGDSFIGDVDLINSNYRRWFIWDGVDFDQPSAAWTENKTGSSYAINELWPLELLRNRKQPLKKFEGAIYGDYNPLFSFRYGLDTFIFNGGSFNAAQSRWEGTWLQVNYSIGDITTDSSQSGAGDDPGDITLSIGRNAEGVLRGSTALDNDSVGYSSVDFSPDDGEIGTITTTALTVAVYAGDFINLFSSIDGANEQLEVNIDAAVGATSIGIVGATLANSYPAGSRIYQGFKDAGGGAGLGGFVKKSGDKMTGNLVMDAASEINFNDIGFKRRGSIVTDASAGLAIVGEDDDLNSTPVSAIGSTFFQGGENIGMIFNDAKQHGFLQIGVPITINGEQVYPLTSAQISQELHRQDFTSSEDVLLNGITSEIVVQGVSDYNYYSGAQFEYEFWVFESSTKSTQIEFWFDVDGVESTRATATIPPQSNTPVFGSGEISTTFPETGFTVQLHVLALETSQGRITTVIGSSNTSKLSLVQYGYGAFSASQAADIATGGLTSVGFIAQDFIIYLETAGDTYTLPLISGSSNRSLTYNLVNVSGASVYLTTTGTDYIYGLNGKFESDAVIEIPDGSNMKISITENYYKII